MFTRTKTKLLPGWVTCMTMKTKQINRKQARKWASRALAPIGIAVCPWSPPALTPDMGTVSMIKEKRCPFFSFFSFPLFPCYQSFPWPQCWTWNSSSHWSPKHSSVHKVPKETCDADSGLRGEDPHPGPYLGLSGLSVGGPGLSCWLCWAQPSHTCENPFTTASGAPQ